MRKIVFFFTVAIFSSTVSAQTWNDTLAQIDKIMERYKPTNPGYQLSISRNGNIIYSKAWGMADLEHSAPLTTNSIIEAGSVSKQFTAAAILLLEQQGKLSINDDVRKYIPELPDYGTPILLRHMIQHTSGLKDWGSIVAVAGWPRSTKTYDNLDALHVVKQQKTLNNKPGAEYIYSNSNYNLLAIIVDRVSGKSLADFTKQFLFDPARMKHTEWRNDMKKIVPNRAIAYGKVATTYYTNMPNENVYGNGGLLTTTEDLLAWNHFYLANKFGNPSLLSNQLTTRKLNNGRMTTYAAGLVVDSLRGWKIISHDGATASYRAALEHFPDLGLSIAWMSNTSEFDLSSSVSQSVRNVFVKDISTKKVKATNGFVLSEPEASRYIGWYRNTRTGGGINFAFKDGKLTSSIGTIIPVSNDEFELGNSKIKMFPGRLQLISQLDTLDYVSVAAAKTDSTSLKQYIGNYYSSETQSAFSVIFKNGNLFLRREPSFEVQLFPTFLDGFNYMGSTILFSRNRKDEVSAFHVSVARARMIEFIREQEGVISPSRRRAR